MKLVDIKDNITSKQKLVLVIVCLVLIILVFSVLKSFNTNDGAIDYKNTDSLDLVIYSSKINERDLYWTLNGIIAEFINTYQSSYNDQIKDLNYYYKALDPDYKKFLGKKKYLEISNNLITKVIGEQKDVFSVTPQPLITDMYRLNKYENAYLCKLSTKNSEDEAYIGIILDTEKTKYNIFYID